MKAENRKTESRNSYNLTAFSLTQTRSKIWTFKAKQNTLDEQIDYVKSSIDSCRAELKNCKIKYTALQLSAFKKELTVLRKIKKIKL